MSSPFVAEIRIFGFNFPPYRWALCNGQLMNISQNTALFSIVGTYYGGNGTSNFALPNLQGRAPIDPGIGAGLSDYMIGQTGGAGTVTLSSAQLAAHAHSLLDGGGHPQLKATPDPADTEVPTGNYPAGTSLGAATWDGGFSTAAPASGSDMLATQTLASGGGAAHNNLPPYLVLNFCIATMGVYPTRS